MADLLTAADAITASISNIAVVIPQLSNRYQPYNGSDPALVFAYEEENTIEIQSDITDHFIENNSAIEDHIALRPEVITVEGFIGELSDIVPKAITPFQNIANNLGPLDSFIPGLSTSAQIAVNTATSAYNAVKSAVDSSVSALSSLGLVPGIQSKQAQMFNLFYSYQQNRILFTVQTPWNSFTDMAILSLTANQDGTTRMITSFSVTFKKIRKAVTSATASQLLTQGIAAAQSAQQVNNGTNSPQNANLGPSSALTYFGLSLGG